MAAYFFEIHNPEEKDRQGPDKGTQYRSGIFYLSEKQRKESTELINDLIRKRYNVATEITPASRFYPAEGYHQQYYDKTGKAPYCHIYTKRF